jgi:hypothetical protein
MAGKMIKLVFGARRVPHLTRAEFQRDPCSASAHARRHAASGIAIALAASRRSAGAFRAPAMGALLAWSTSISIGYPTPALAIGVTWLLAALAFRPPTHRWVFGIAMLLAASITVRTVLRERESRVYRDLPPDHDTAVLTGVLPGADGIRTGAWNYALMRDLRDAVETARPHPYAIVPELPQWWVAARETNPLLLDWHYYVELPTVALRERAERRLAALPCETVLIKLRYSDERFRIRDYPILGAVAEHWVVQAQVGRFDLMRRRDCVMDKAT